jgi:hypothetical protein
LRALCDGVIGALRVEALHHPPPIDAAKVVGQLSLRWFEPNTRHHVSSYISANSASQDLPVLSARAAVLRTVAFHPSGRVTVRFGGNIPDRSVQKVRSLDG